MQNAVLLLTIVCLVRAQDRFIPDNYEEVSKENMTGFGALDKCGEGATISTHKCVEYFRCSPDTGTILPDEEEGSTNGFGLIDIRFGANSCAHPLDVCCKTSDNGGTTSSTLSPPTPIPSRPPPKPMNSFCGIRNENGIDFKITGNNHQEAEYGEFPWMVAILTLDQEATNHTSPAVCGGSLIAPKVVLTAAHCVNKLNPKSLKVRAGEWDTQTTKERLPYQERQVAEVHLHEHFQNGVLYNDAALLILARSFKPAENVGTICLPEPNEAIISQHCFATGWGKNLFDKEGEYQVILKKIELPTVPHRECEQILQGTRLGRRFKLHESFMCAGGEEGKDTCTGDGGSPLVCPDPQNAKRYVQAGIVAWGIGCHSKVPGVYGDVAKFRNWVDSRMLSLGLSNQPYLS